MNFQRSKQEGVKMGEHKTNPTAMAAQMGQIARKNSRGQQRVNINPDDLPRRSCKNCKAEIFVIYHRFLEVPELMRFATKGADHIQLQSFACAGCGTIQAVREMEILPPVNKPEEGKSIIEVVR